MGDPAPRLRSGIILSYTNRLRDGIGEMLLNPGVLVPAGTTRWGAAFHNRRQFCSRRVESEGIKRILAPGCSLPILILQAMDSNSDYTFSVVPRLLDFVGDPPATCCLAPDKNNCAGTCLYLLFNPPLDSCILTPLDGFPVIVGDGRVPIDHSQIPHLSGPPSIRLVMKAEEYTSFQSAISFKDP